MLTNKITFERMDTGWYFIRLNGKRIGRVYTLSQIGDDRPNPKRKWCGSVSIIGGERAQKHLEHHAYGASKEAVCKELVAMRDTVLSHLKR